MKKQTYFYLCMSIAFLCITGCTQKENQEVITPSPVIEGKENESTKLQGAVFKEQEETKETDGSKNKEDKKPTSNVITKTDGLCEQLEKVETDVTLYNIVNRMLGTYPVSGVEKHSMFCLDETTGVIYFVNEGKDNFLYRMKDGEVALAVAMPMKQLYPYEGSVYFMVDDYGKYQLDGMKTGDIYCYTPSQYSDPFCQDSFLMNLSLGDKHTFLQNIGTDYPLLPLIVMNLGIINVSRTCHEVVPASLIH